MLIIHQAILVPGMTANLLSTMQLRDNNLRVNDEPKHMALTPTEDHHAIVIPAYNLDGEQHEELRIPLAFKGVTSYFPTRKPTRQEYEKSELDRRYELTAESPEWDPSTTRFEEQEAAMLDEQGTLLQRTERPHQDRLVASLYSIPQNGQPDYDLAQALSSNVKIRPTAKDKRNVVLKSIETDKRLTSFSTKTLAKNWGIGLETARRTLEATTQRGV